MDFVDMQWESYDEWETYFQLSNFRLVTNNTIYGPYGSSDSRVNRRIQRKPVIIPIDNGDVVAQAINSFIYPNKDDEPVHLTNRKCFSFYVSFQDKRTLV